MTLATLHEMEAGRRLDALETLDVTAVGAFGAVRDVLLGDEDATVRAAAARLFERARAFVGSGERRRADARCIAVTALVDALYDTHPSVRMAACRALAKLEAPSPGIYKIPPDGFITLKSGSQLAFMGMKPDENGGLGWKRMQVSDGDAVSFGPGVSFEGVLFRTEFEGNGSTPAPDSNTATGAVFGLLLTF